MNEYSINIVNGKVVGDSAFYRLVNNLLSVECKRLCYFTESLDNDLLLKKEKIIEYKCAKYRYAAVSLIHSVIYNNHKFRKEKNLEASHYLLQPFDEYFKSKDEILVGFTSTPLYERPDYSLYFGILSFVDSELRELISNLQTANDFEKIELQERADGLRFAKDCLHAAWERRKEVQL